MVCEFPVPCVCASRIQGCSVWSDQLRLPPPEFERTKLCGADTPVPGAALKVSDAGVAAMRGRPDPPPAAGATTSVTLTLTVARPGEAICTSPEKVPGPPLGGVALTVRSAVPVPALGRMLIQDCGL